MGGGRHSVSCEEIAKAKPSAGHHALAELEAYDVLKYAITQTPTVCIERQADEGFWSTTEASTH